MSDKKLVYDAAFAMYKSQSKMENLLYDIGVKIEYGDNVLGEHYETINNGCEAIILESLGLHLVEEDCIMHAKDTKYASTINILYNEEEDENFCIIEDDFYDMCAKIIADENGPLLKELLWQAIVNKDTESKKKFIGIYGKETVIGVMHVPQSFFEEQ